MECVLDLWSYCTVYTVSAVNLDIGSVLCFTYDVLSLCSVIRQSLSCSSTFIELRTEAIYRATVAYFPGLVFIAGGIFIFVILSLIIWVHIDFHDY